MIRLWRCKAHKKLTNSQHEAKKFEVELSTVWQDRHLRILILLFFGWWLYQACTSKGMPLSAYMVYDRSIIDYDFILRLYLWLYHSLHCHRWWTCWQAHRTSVSKRWIHRVHDQLQAAGRPKKRFLFGHLFFNITNVFCAKKRVGHACICSRMVTG